MNETDSTRDLSTAPKDAREVTTDFKTGGTRCSARSTRTGAPCKRPAMLGGNVCYHHGGNAPQVKAKAQRRLQQAADALVQRLLGMALDGDTPDHVALAAIRDALDRAGMGAKHSVELSAKAPEPWEELLGDVAQITRAQYDAVKRGEPVPLAPVPALPPGDTDIVDAEIVDIGPGYPPSSTGATPDAADRGDGTASQPAWGEDAPTQPGNALVALTPEVLAEVNRVNRAAGALPPAKVGRVKRPRR